MRFFGLFLFILTWLSLPLEGHAVSSLRGVDSSSQALLLKSVVGLRAAGEELECSGVLIGHNLVLTAAHCAVEQMDKPLEVLFYSSPKHIKAAIAVKTLTRMTGFTDLQREYQEHIRIYYSIVERVRAAVAPIFNNQIPFCAIDTQGKEIGVEQLYELMIAPPLSLARSSGSEACQKQMSDVFNIMDDYVAHEVPVRQVLEGRAQLDLALLELEGDAPAGNLPAEMDFSFTGSTEGMRILVAGFGHHDDHDELGTFGAGFTSVLGLKADRVYYAGESVVCPGDSGGFTGYIKNAKVYLAGINFGHQDHGCDYKSGVGNSTLLSVYKNWILKLVAP